MLIFYIMNKPGIAIIFTCFNRKEKTLACMKSIYTETNKAKYNIHFYICDDCSTDGTYEELTKVYPGQTIFQSKGNLFWCKSMHEGMKLAIKDKYDFYLMINDDVEFKESVIDELFNTYNKTNGDCAIVGETVSKITSEITYGGSCFTPRKVLFFQLCYNNKWFAKMDDNNLVECDLANWNCFFIPQSIIDEVGIIDGKYQHGYGDYDFSLRLKKADKKQYITNHPIGYCERNKTQGTFVDAAVPKKLRFKKMISIKSMPVYSHYRFHWRHFGLLGIMQVTWSYIIYSYKILSGKDI